MFRMVNIVGLEDELVFDLDLVVFGANSQIFHFGCSFQMILRDCNDSELLYYCSCVGWGYCKIEASFFEHIQKH